MDNSTPIRISPKHVFLHLFAIIMLYSSAANLLTLIFQYINVLAPDSLSQIGYDQTSRYQDLIRFSISFIVIVFPALVWISWFLDKNYKKEPEVRNMKIRKWLIYFTLFIAGLIIIGDLIGIIRSFLGGEITIRFILKSLSVFFLAGLIFGYYLWDSRREFPSANKKLKYFVWIVSGLVTAVVITGFFVIGSPAKERTRRFDQQRVNNLQNIQFEIVNYWINKRVLPENLSALENSISGYKAPTDPQTNEPYAYSVKGSESFELCAVFSLADNFPQNLEPRAVKPIEGGYGQNWQHNAGKTCFERKIDKELYPLRERGD
ncbi:MAG: DUF5671 domain-containing protein [Patescibacteria group bacterium]